MEVVKTELDRNGIVDINNVQALILFNISDEELTVGELTNRGYYLGSNVSYNVRKMVENGYLRKNVRPTTDARSACACRPRAMTCARSSPICSLNKPTPVTLWRRHA